MADLFTVMAFYLYSFHWSPNLSNVKANKKATVLADYHEIFGELK
jgi:hypothetical protein